MNCNHCNQWYADDYKLRKCSACKSVYYCDRKCQKADWKVHKETCCHSEPIDVELKKAIINLNLFLGNNPNHDYTLQLRAKLSKWVSSGRKLSLHVIEKWKTWCVNYEHSDDAFLNNKYLKQALGHLMELKLKYMTKPNFHNHMINTFEHIDKFDELKPLFEEHACIWGDNLDKAPWGMGIKLQGVPCVFCLAAPMVDKKRFLEINQCFALKKMHHIYDMYCQFGSSSKWYIMIPQTMQVLDCKSDPYHVRMFVSLFTA